MSWSIAQAKQQFSEVVRLAAAEPQAIYKRTTPVAMVIGADDFAQFKQWQASKGDHPLADSLARLRADLQDAGFDGIEIEPRSAAGRPNAFTEMLDQDYPAPNAIAAAAASKKSAPRSVPPSSAAQTKLAKGRKRGAR